MWVLNFNNSEVYSSSGIVFSGSVLAMYTVLYTSNFIQKYIYIYIYIYILCLSVCPFVSNKRQNCWKIEPKLCIQKFLIKVKLKK